MDDMFPIVSIVINALHSVQVRIRPIDVLVYVVKRNGVRTNDSLIYE